MKIYIKPFIFVITMDETPLLAESDPQRGFNVSGDGGTSGGIREIGEGEAGDGTAFSKQYNPSFDDTTDPEW